MLPLQLNVRVKALLGGVLKWGLTIGVILSVAKCSVVILSEA